ncbi:MAG: SH3 domain-containing protein [Desulfuromonas sp.]|nr:MAG: SH3 domain-containing protein [Desulfuromonas sp.]
MLGQTAKSKFLSLITMKGKVFRVCVLLLLSGFAGELLAANLMIVQVRQGQVRSKPSFLSPIELTLKYGQSVETGEQRDGWIAVNAPDGQGWMHQSALTSRRITLQTDGRQQAVQASSDEIALAGKGFNAEVEAAYRNRNLHLDFHWLDRMDRLEIPAEQLAIFLAEGGLVTEGGGR